MWLITTDGELVDIDKAFLIKKERVPDNTGVPTYFVTAIYPRIDCTLFGSTNEEERDDFFKTLENHLHASFIYKKSYCGLPQEIENGK
ncbi:hypothetical protein R83H12_00405 [Fibrobacteria bacterium R8-3-H12]